LRNKNFTTESLVVGREVCKYPAIVTIVWGGMEMARKFAQQTRPVDRRGFLRGVGAAGVALTLPELLAACGTKGSKQSASSCVSKDISATDKTLNFSNWPEYIDVSNNGKRMPSLENFMKQSGIKVTYNTDINDNNQFFAKVQNQLGDCQPIGRDIITMTDWMAGKMINLGWIQKLDADKIPNVHANLIDSLKSPGWDKKRDYSVPWQSGLTGIAYNAKYTGEIKSMKELITRSDLKGKVTMLTEMRDTMGFMLKIVGADPEKFSQSDWENALDELKKAVAAGQFRRFTGNDYVDDLNAGNIVACEAWSGDVIAMQFDNPDIKWVVPEEGLAIWADNMMVPNKADHKANAEALMNYYYEPEVAATVSAWVNYICPVDGAQQAMEKIDKSLVDNDLIFPSADFLAQTFLFQDLDEKTARTYETDFTHARGA
jgi:spermidine/putrescine transport system substrate-binding protein